MEQHEINLGDSTIAAVATPPGQGGIAVVRVSGPQALDIVSGAWRGKDLREVTSHTVHLGKYISTDGAMLDEAVATVFRAPNSFTGEDVVELGLHGSRWIQREVVADLIRRGAEGAGRGEFTQRAFMNGRLDLAQAEGIADLIASSSRAAHRLALTQTRGGFSRDLENVREELIELASLLELELDFSEEDVEFADRSRLIELAEGLLRRLRRLASSYSSGAVLKEGVPVVIAGIPNAGKSSLLNILAQDDRAIVSDIPGTTRDTIEETVEINGILFRFIDTAGLRSTEDTVESLGIERARRKMKEARIVVWIFDPTQPLPSQLEEYENFRSQQTDQTVIPVIGKQDLSPTSVKGIENAIAMSVTGGEETVSPILMSMTEGEGIATLREALTKAASGDFDPETEFIVTNSRHYEALLRGADALERALAGISTGLSADFIAQDIREATTHLGTITGTVTTDTLLHSIFSRFCIGK